MLRLVGSMACNTWTYQYMVRLKETEQHLLILCGCTLLANIDVYK